MGIRFRCDRCNKRLNVKAKHAGEYCICPHCEGEILVPTQEDKSATIVESRRPKQSTSGEKDESGGQTSAATSPSGNTVVMETSPKSGIFLVGAPTASGRGNGVAALKKDGDPDSGPQPNPVPNNSDDQTITEAQAEQSTPSTSNASDSQITPPRSLPASDEQMSDSGNSFMLGKPEIRVEQNPLRANPNLVWYARHRRHGEKGPLKARDVEAMLDSGKLRADWIVWRQDWNDWLPADEVFPQLLVPENTEDGDYGIPEELNPHSDASKAQRKKKAILLGSIAVAFLAVIVLVYLLFRLY